MTVLLPAAGAQPRTGGGPLRAKEARLSRQAHAALLDLYSIEAKLTQARAKLAAAESAQARLEELARERQREVTIVTTSALDAQTQLAQQLRALYEQTPPDPIAVVLGAESIDEAISNLDNLNRVARQSKAIVHETLDTRAHLLRALAHLDSDRRSLAAARSTAAAETARLEAAAGARKALIARLEQERAGTSVSLAALDQQAKAAAHKSIALTQTATATARTQTTATPPTSSGGPPAPGRSLTVEATAYALPGHTASGLPVGHGIAAVDPSVIPLGTRFRVPGYGMAVAADVGSGIRGAMIDLWFPTIAQARAWGRRTLTITFV